LTQRGFNWRTFLREGASEQALLATGDGLAEQVIRRKHERADG
jgi:hypothetical protein